MDKNKYNEIMLAIEDDGKKITYVEARELIHWIEYEGIRIYSGMTSRAWVSTINDILDAVSG